MVLFIKKLKFLVFCSCFHVFSTQYCKSCEWNGSSCDLSLNGRIFSHSVNSLVTRWLKCEQTTDMDICLNLKCQWIPSGDGYCIVPPVEQANEEAKLIKEVSSAECSTAFKEYFVSYQVCILCWTDSDCCNEINKLDGVECGLTDGYCTETEAVSLALSPRSDKDNLWESLGQAGCVTASAFGQYLRCQSITDEQKCIDFCRWRDEQNGCFVDPNQMINKETAHYFTYLFLYQDRQECSMFNNSECINTCTDTKSVSVDNSGGISIDSGSIYIDCHNGIQNMMQSYCTPDCPCNIGEGDCNDDSDCIGKLICKQQSGIDICAIYTPIIQDNIQDNIQNSIENCHDPYPNGHSQYCSIECKCDKYEGDCDTDDQCKDGLMCLQLTGIDVCFPPGQSYTPPIEDNNKIYIPPPSGGLVGISNCHIYPIMHADYCNYQCPCDIGEGDCDTDEECIKYYICPQKDGTDVCIDPQDPTRGLEPKASDECTAHRNSNPANSPDHCTERCPCGEGEGDCDNDKQCQEGHYCVEDAGTDYCQVQPQKKRFSSSTTEKRTRPSSSDKPVRGSFGSGGGGIGGGRESGDGGSIGGGRDTVGGGRAGGDGSIGASIGGGRGDRDGVGSSRENGGGGIGASIGSRGDRDSAELGM
eukprot:GHVL01037701.1.p1 GENE.GHVL01037701.1~~GHVL01037701.1.p1  ORF type:complete len:643 (+),score=146.95 GHVL01037701.1:29-1957(+)